MMVKIRMVPMPIAEGQDAAALGRVLRDLQLSDETRTFMEHVAIVVRAATTQEYQVTMVLNCTPTGKQRK
jgi:hypothetical protein